jgi:hypothetical protein
MYVQIFEDLVHECGWGGVACSRTGNWCQEAHMLAELCDQMLCLHSVECRIQ